MPAHDYDLIAIISILGGCAQIMDQKMQEDKLGMITELLGLVRSKIIATDKSELNISFLVPLLGALGHAG